MPPLATNPIRLLLPGSGATTGRDRAGDAALTVAGAVRTASGPASRVVFRDLFDRADGAPGVAPTGQVWYTQGGALTASIVDGRLTIPTDSVGQKASYSAVDVEAMPARMSGRFSFTGTAGRPDSVVLICSNGQGGQLNGNIAWANMVHFSTSPQGWFCNFYLDKVAQTSVMSGAHALATDGTVYEVSIEFDADAGTATVTAPDGSKHTVADTRFFALGGPHLIYECYVDNAAPPHAIGRWESVEASVPFDLTGVAALAIEEGTVNECPDPVFGNATVSTNWAVGSGVTLSRSTTETDDGYASGKAVCDGSTASQGISMAAAKGPSAGVGETWTVSADVWTSDDATVGKTVQLVGLERNASTVATTSHFSTNSIALTRTPQRIAWTFLTTDATIHHLGLRIVFVGTKSGTIHASKVQLERKAYATSLAHGGLGTGYAWAGTAHSSATVRAAATATLDPAGRLSPLRGAVAGWVTRDYATGAAQTILAAGTNAAGSDRIALAVDAAGNVALAAGSDGGATATAGDATTRNPVGVAQHVYADWTPTRLRLSVDGGPFAVAARATPVGAFGAVLALGSEPDGTAALNGRIGPLLTARRALSPRQRSAARRRAGAWGYGIVRPEMMR